MEPTEAPPDEVPEPRVRKRRTCPFCGANHVRRSRRKGIKDKILIFLFMAPFRCRKCRTRYYGYAAPWSHTAQGL